MNVEQEVHNRDYQIRNDHEETLLERELFQQDQIVAKMKQQLLFQRDLMYEFPSVPSGKLVKN